MRGLQITLLILGLLIMSTQTFRHVYVKWIEPRGSVLDEFRDDVEEDIAETKSLDELKELYRQAHGKVEAFEEKHPEAKVRMRADQALYVDEEEIEQAIRRVEGQRKSIFELWFYWLCGLGSVLLGLLAYRKFSRWLGMVGLITGFTEMAFWTSPLWRSAGPQGEFERLLTLKLLLSVVSVALLVTLWLVSERRRRASAA